MIVTQLAEPWILFKPGRCAVRSHPQLKSEVMKRVSCLIATTPGSDVCVSRSACYYQEGMTRVFVMHWRLPPQRTGDYAFIRLYALNLTIAIMYILATIKKFKQDYAMWYFIPFMIL